MTRPRLVLLALPVLAGISTVGVEIACTNSIPGRCVTITRPAARRVAPAPALADWTPEGRWGR